MTRTPACLQVLGAIALLALVLTVPAHAQESAYPVLELELGARPAGLGGAFTSVSGTAESVFYNPAGIGSIERTTIAVDFQKRFAEIDILSAAAGSPLFGGAAGVGIVYLNHGEIEEEVDFHPTGRTLSSYDLAVTGTYALRLVEDVWVGGTGRLLTSEIADRFGATSVSADLGVQVEGLFDRLALGAAVRNLGSDVKLEGSDRSDPLPRQLRLGGSVRLLGAAAEGAQMLLAADLVSPRGGDVRLGLGSEVAWRGAGGPLRALAGRAGYHGGGAEGDQGTFTVGLGLATPAVEMDYAFEAFDALGDVHRFTLTFTP